MVTRWPVLDYFMMFISGFVRRIFFSLGCYVIPLARFDIVLDVRWLRSLGPIMRDFEQLIMSFWLHDHKVIWHSLQVLAQHANISALTGDTLMTTLLEEFANVFEKPHGLPP